MTAKIVSQPGNDGRARVFAGADVVADAVRVTLGPRGRHALLEESWGAPTVINSGPEIASSITLPDSFENIGCDMIQTVVSQTKEAVGDGSATATVMARAILLEGVRALNAGADPIALKRGIDRATSEVVRALEKLARPCRDVKQIMDVANLSASGSEGVAKMLGEAIDRVGKDGLISIEEGKGLDDELSVVNGTEIPGGYMSPYFINDQLQQLATLENCRVLLCEAKIENTRDLLPFLEGAAKTGSALVIVAEDIGGEALATLVVNFIRGIIKVLAIKLTVPPGTLTELLGDLALLTGGTVIGPSTGTSLAKATFDDLGTAHRVSASQHRTSLQGATADRDRLHARANFLKKEAKESASDQARERLEERIMRLLGGVAVYRVGGSTEREIKERKKRADSALRSIRAAMEEGIVPGGGVALLRAQQAIREIERRPDSEEAGIEVLTRALEEPLRQIAENSELNPSEVVATLRRNAHDHTRGIDASTRKYVDVYEAGIVDPLKVMRVALQNAASVAGLLLTAGVFVAEDIGVRAPITRRRVGIPRGDFGNRFGYLRSHYRPERAYLEDATLSGPSQPVYEPQVESQEIETAGDDNLIVEPERASQLPERFLNTCFIGAYEPAPLPPNISLICARPYRLRVDIGEYRQESLERDPVGVPEGYLPKSADGHWLEIVVVGDRIRTEARRWPLFLPTTGNSWVCECVPGTVHTCTEDERQAFLCIPFNAGMELGDTSIRLGLYFERNLLQSQLITVTVADRAREAPPAEARTDYRITDGLRDVPALSHRTINILTNDNPDWTHRLMINGEKDDPISYTLTDGQVQNAMDSVRQGLVDIHIKKIDPTSFSSGTKNNRYRPDNSKQLGEFKDDLKMLAREGRILWTSLAMNRFDMSVLRFRLETRANIQVARTKNSRLAFPWALIYDLMLEPGNPGAYSICEFVDEWYAPTAKTNDIPDRCPHHDSHRPNVVCPYGFWGIRHVIEQPPSRKGDLPTKIRVRQNAEFIAALSKDLDFEKHLEEIQSLAGPHFEVRKCDTRSSIQAALVANPALEFLYFYCHGRHAKKPGTNLEETYLEVGKQEQLMAGDVAAWNEQAEWEDHWKEIAPLVLINGCHTTDMTPRALTTLVDAFTNAYAAGVIGTETTIHENVAREAVELMVGHLFGGARQRRSVGEAIRWMRFELLRKGNVMGLTYTAYCSSDLTFVEPQ